MTAGGKLVTGSLGVEGTAADGNGIWTPGNGTVELTANNTLPTTVFTNFTNLILTNGTTTLSTDITIVGNLEIDASAVLDLGTFANSTATLSFGGVQQVAGEWGAIGSGAAHESERLSGLGRMTVTGPALPGFAAEPVSQTVLEGQLVVFSVVVTGTPPHFVQWQRNSNNIAGATGLSYSIATASMSDDGAAFRAIVSTTHGQATSSNATLTVVAQAAPTIVQPPSSTSKYPADTVQFTVVAQGTPPMCYQWRKAGENLTDSGNLFGASTTNLTITNIVAENAGDYTVVVTNSIGSVTSSVAVLTVLPTGPAQTLTLDYGGVPIVQGVGLDWNTVANWSDGKAASESALANPGSTYKVVPGSLLRTPNGAADATFPGAVLMVEGDGVYANGGSSTIGEIRLKQGPEGIVHFKKLMMNGGQLNAGNPGNVTIAGGEVNILANSVLYNDSNDSDRGYRIDSWLTGAGTIEYRGYSQFAFRTDYTRPLNITGTSNTFSGTWNIVIGVLLGSGPNALGSNDITIGANAALETSYPINNPNGALILDGQMFLHQNDSFRAVTVAGTDLPPGTYTFDQLNSLYPANFPATWTLQTGSSVSTGSGSLTVLGSPPPPVILGIQLSGSDVKLTWSQGTLLEATNIAGLWTTNNAATPPSYTVPLTGPMKFYRVQVR